MPYEVLVEHTGDRAEADDLAEALYTAAQLVDDHFAATGLQGAASVARASITICEVQADGSLRVSGIATGMARQGIREPFSAQWSHDG